MGDVFAFEGEEVEHRTQWDVDLLVVAVGVPTADSFMTTPMTWKRYPLSVMKEPTEGRPGRGACYFSVQEQPLGDVERDRQR